MLIIQHSFDRICLAPDRHKQPLVDPYHFLHATTKTISCLNLWYLHIKDFLLLFDE